MGRILDVATGEVAVAGDDAEIVCRAIGSCIAVVCYDPVSCIGGIAHVMLPGSAPLSRVEEKERYADNGVARLLDRLGEAGAVSERLVVCLAGGGNVLRREDDTICSANITSVTAAIRQRNLVVAAASTGGACRRRVRLNTRSGILYCAVGDDGETILWRHDAANAACGAR